MFSQLDAAVSGHDGAGGGIDAGIEHLVRRYGMDEEDARAMLMAEMRKPKALQDDDGDDGLPDTKDTD